jgi:hypothetical protein
MRYAKTESLYAEPFAEGLVSNAVLRSWVLHRTEFAEFADEARLLHREMLAVRSAGARNWWQSHYTEACRCAGCRGQETDLLAIFETEARQRLAIHFEVKHPRDDFKKPTQAACYAIRAQCWVNSPPNRVLPHHRATTALLCSASRLPDYAPHLRHFQTVVTFEDVEQNFPKFWERSRAGPRNR